MNFLKRKLTPTESIILAIIIAFLSFDYVLIFCCLASLILNNAFLPVVYSKHFWLSFEPRLFYNLKNLFFFSAGEEFVWRILPFSILIWCLRKTVNRFLMHLILVIAVVLSSLNFAFYHATQFNLFIQGMLGVFWSFLFLKISEGGNRLFLASIAVILAHWLYNSFVLLNGYFFVRYWGGL